MCITATVINRSKLTDIWLLFVKNGIQSTQLRTQRALGLPIIQTLWDDMCRSSARTSLYVLIYWRSKLHVCQKELWPISKTASAPLTYRLTKFPEHLIPADCLLPLWYLQADLRLWPNSKGGKIPSCMSKLHFCFCMKTGKWTCMKFFSFGIKVTHFWMRALSLSTFWPVTCFSDRTTGGGDHQPKH